MKAQVLISKFDNFNCLGIVLCCFIYKMLLKSYLLIYLDVLKVFDYSVKFYYLRRSRLLLLLLMLTKTGQLRTKLRQLGVENTTRTAMMSHPMPAQTIINTEQRTSTTGSGRIGEGQQRRRTAGLL